MSIATHHAKLLLAVIVLFVCTISCVLLDPVPELQKPIRRAPNINKTELFPDNTRPLLELPSQFVIPVRVADPGQSFEWAFFVDYDLANPNNGFLDDDVVPGSPTGPDVHNIQIDTTQFPSIDPTRCHRFEFIATLRFRRRHEADPNISDSVSWWYVPEGSGGCGLYDAAALPPLDAGTDADIDGATQ